MIFNERKIVKQKKEKIKKAQKDQKTVSDGLSRHPQASRGLQNVPRGPPDELNVVMFEKSYGVFIDDHQ